MNNPPERWAKSKSPVKSNILQPMLKASIDLLEMKGLEMSTLRNNELWLSVKLLEKIRQSYIIKV